MTGFKIREGRKEDCGQILQMIKLLAKRYEDSVCITQEDLERDGFGDNPVFKVLVAEEVDKDDNAMEGGKLIGYALFYNIFDPKIGRCLFGEDFFVAEEHRSKGIGDAIMKTGVKISLETGCSAFQFEVFSPNKPLVKWYKRLGAKDVTEEEEGKWHLFRLDRVAMSKL